MAQRDVVRNAAAAMRCTHSKQHPPVQVIMPQARSDRARSETGGRDRDPRFLGVTSSPQRMLRETRGQRWARAFLATSARPHVQATEQAQIREQHGALFNMASRQSLLKPAEKPWRFGGLPRLHVSPR
jgi:hypothetical protein